MEVNGTGAPLEGCRTFSTLPSSHSATSAKRTCTCRRLSGSLPCETLRRRGFKHDFFLKREVPNVEVSAKAVQGFHNVAHQA